ncbi:DNA-binding transcriptional LysR family regulator [Arthrobacter sp. V4I6]|nr:LysR family transcriptional regulator [Arthrobacter sp. V1I7]MDQ0823660.1 DNA-binding transcriptional LysR family regulator [Arthrobacter sp. V1I7]MDQ0853294.1 DNA-binding transcriptional LysR family regulator [Arthrobacter sp. V4I6]
MELRHIRYFLAVSEEGSFGRAAQRLHISQPALSRQIVDLERNLGQRLFDRTTKGVVLTPAGEALIGHGRQLLRLESATRHIVASTTHAEQPVVLGVPPTVSEQWFLDLISALQAALPTVPFQVFEAYTVEQLRMLREGQIDLMLINQRPPGNLRRAALSESSHPFGIAVPPEHRLAKQNAFGLADLAGLRILARMQDQVPASHDLAIREIEDSGVVVLWVFGRFAEHARACAVAAQADAVFCGEATARRQLPGWHWGSIEELRTGMTLWLGWSREAREKVSAAAHLVMRMTGSAT